MRAFCGGEASSRERYASLWARAVRGGGRRCTDLDVGAPAAPRHLYGAAHPHFDDASRVSLVVLLQAVDARRQRICVAHERIVPLVQGLERRAVVHELLEQRRRVPMAVRPARQAFARVQDDALHERAQLAAQHQVFAPEAQPRGCPLAMVPWTAKKEGGVACETARRELRWAAIDAHFICHRWTLRRNALASRKAVRHELSVRASSEL